VNRTRATGVVLAFALVAIALLAWRWPSGAPTLECPPEAIHLGPDGVARCGPGAPLPAGQAVALHQALDLNRVSADELALVPGVPAEVARAVVAERTRLGHFSTWDQVDAVEGVGPARLAVLQSHCVFGAGDGGVW
jgi:competence protein ComEA